MSGGRIVGRIPFKSPEQRDVEERRRRLERWLSRIERLVQRVESILARARRRRGRELGR